MEDAYTSTDYKWKGYRATELGVNSLSGWGTVLNTVLLLPFIGRSVALQRRRLLRIDVDIDGSAFRAGYLSGEWSSTIRDLCATTEAVTC